MKRRSLLGCLLLAVALLPSPHANATKTQKKEGPANRVLIVMTSHYRLGDTGKKTGYYLCEVTHPYFELTKNKGVTVDFASISGGNAPIDEKSWDLSDEKNRKFMGDSKLSTKLERTLPIEKVDATKYAAVIFAGGHGTMWDFPEDKDVARVIKTIYERGGVVAALCHGPAALINAKLSNGKYLVNGKNVTGFSNEEEAKVGLTKVVPYLLEEKLKERGAKYSKAAPFQAKVVTDGRLITGQNPASGTAVGQAVSALLPKQ